MTDIYSKRADGFPDTPEGEAQRWSMEISASKDYFQKWFDEGDEITRIFLDERVGDERGDKRVNLFTSNIQIQRSIVYGRTPAVDVRRQFSDASDDVARVAGVILERALNADIDRAGDSYAEALGQALDDRQLRGQGQVRVRYEPVFETTPGVDGAPIERKVSETVAIDYVFWKDFLRSPARTESEVRWQAFRNELSPEDVERRWGKEVADAIPYSIGKTRSESGESAPNPWQRAEVWEIWDKPTRTVVWWVDGYDRILESMEDPLSLSGFWPCPRPMRANPTTGTVVPRPDYCLAEDLYKEVNVFAEQIHNLMEAVRVTGAYDGKRKELADIFSGRGNKLIAIDNFPALQESGGIRAAIDLLPLDPIVQAISIIGQQMEATKQQLYEVTGMSDLLRGQAAESGATALEQRVKTRFASTRLRQQQAEFARFASEAQALKAEIICRLFDTESISRMANVEFMSAPDKAYAPAALALLKDAFLEYRVRVDPESVAMADFASDSQEATELMGAVTQFMGAAMPLVQALGPQVLPFLLSLLQSIIARMKGGDELEGVIDSAIAGAQQMAAQAQQPQQPAPDPRAQAQIIKGQQEAARDERSTQADLARIQAEKEAKMELEQNQTRENLKESLGKAQINAAFARQTPRGGL